MASISGVHALSTVIENGSLTLFWSVRVARAGVPGSSDETGFSLHAETTVASTRAVSAQGVECRMRSASGWFGVATNFNWRSG